LNELYATDEANNWMHPSHRQDVLLEDGRNTNAVAFEFDYLAFVSANWNDNVGDRLTLSITLIFSN
jgi:hypothetical protein